MCAEASAILVAVAADFFFDGSHLEVSTDVIINITTAVLYIIRRPVLYLKHTVSKPILSPSFEDFILSPSSAGTYSGGPVTETRSICWAQLSKFHLKTETESSLRNVLF
jgi:hypothetical protein